MGILKYAIIPILLSIAAVAGVFFLTDPVILAASFGLVVVTWLLALHLSNKASAADEDEESEQTRVEMRRATLDIIERINAFLDEELALLDGSLQKIQLLAKDAVVSLTQSLHSLKHQVKRQSKLLHELAGIWRGEEETPKEEVLSIGQYLDDSASAIRYFSALLKDIDESGKAQIVLMEEQLEHIHSIRDLADHPDSGCGREIRRSIVALKARTERHIGALQGEKTEDPKRKGASVAIRRMAQARKQMAHMRDVVAMNVAAFSTQSTKDVNAAVQSLQFEDIVTQLVDGAKQRLADMNQLVTSLNKEVNHLKLVASAEEPIGVLKVVRQIEADIEEYTERLKASRTEPVGQTSMDEGSVELF